MTAAPPASQIQWRPASYGRTGGEWGSGSERLRERDLGFGDGVAAVLVEAMRGGPYHVRADADHGVAFGDGPLFGGCDKVAANTMAARVLVHDQSADLGERVRREDPSRLHVAPPHELAGGRLRAQQFLARLAEEDLQPPLDLLERRGISELPAQRDKGGCIALLNRADAHGGASLFRRELDIVGAGAVRRVHRLAKTIDPVIRLGTGIDVVRIAVRIDRGRDAVQDIEEAIDLLLLRRLAALERVHLVLHRLHIGLELRHLLLDLHPAGLLAAPLVFDRLVVVLLLLRHPRGQLVGRFRHVEHDGACERGLIRGRDIADDARHEPEPAERHRLGRDIGHAGTRGAWTVVARLAGRGLGGLQLAGWKDEARHRRRLTDWACGERGAYGFESRRAVRGGELR